MGCCVRLFTWLVLIASGYLLLFTLYDTIRIACEYFQRHQLFVTYNNNYNFMEELQDPQIYQISIQPDIQIQKLDLQNNNKDDLNYKQAINLSQNYNNLSKKQQIISFDAKTTEKLNRKYKRVFNGSADANLRNKIQKVKQQETKKPQHDRKNREFVEQHQRKKQNGQKNGLVFYVKDDHFTDCVQRKTLPGLRGKIIKSFVRARDPKMCKNIAENNVKLVGLVAMHHKAGTVLRKGFYFSICARSGINFQMLQDLPIQLMQKTHFSNWQNYPNIFQNDNFQNLQNQQTDNYNFFQTSRISENKIKENQIVQTRKLNYRVKSNDHENFRFDENKQFNFNIFRTEMQNNSINNGSNIICRDYHPCNDRAIVHAKITFRENCFDMGVKCKNWYSILCFAQQCKNKLQINKNIRIINPIRNPFNMIISAYLYHKGSSPENWAENLTLGQIGFLHPINGKDLRNISLSSALNQHNTRVGLEIVFRVMSNDLLDMLLLHQFSKTQKNIMSSKFEECMKMFNVSMIKELDFIGFYDEKVSQQEKEQIVEYGSWVTSERNLKMQRRKRHITSDQSKARLYQVLQNHLRFKQLQKIAEMLGYDSQFKI